MPRPRPVVIVLEDQPELGKVLTAVLGTEGFDVIQLRSADDALAALREQNVEFLVSDLASGPREEGSALSTIAQEFPDLPVIVIRDERADDVPFFGPWKREGSWLMLQRPFKLDDLVAASNEVFSDERPTL